MYLSQSLELVLHSLQITIRDHFQKWLLEICTTTCLLGLSAFFRTARTLFTTLQGSEFLPWKISIFVVMTYTSLVLLNQSPTQVGAQSAQMKMVPVPLHGGFSWQAYSEETDSEGDNTFTMVGLLEQINTTRDVTDYLWYMTE